jgi:EAL domain-containing protein (putative c-di-GMP-specific phosphodiesterase class I)
MSALLILTACVTLSVAVTLSFGYRDGWLSARPAPARQRRSPALVEGHNYAAVARLVKFDAWRRRIGYQDANCILKILGERLENVSGCQVARIGRNSIEFVFASESDASAVHMLHHLHGLLEQPVAIDCLRFEPLIAIGSNRILPLQLPEELFEMSVFAVEDASRQSERISLVQPSQLTSSTDLSARVLPDLTNAIRTGGLDLHYMPKLRLQDGEVIGAEALCRWHHIRHGSVPPSVFIKIAEETGLIGDLTLWTLDRAIADQKQLADHQVPLPIDVNLSGLLVSDAKFCDRLLERLEHAGGMIGLEITETAAIEDPAAGLVNLRRLADRGVHIAIDDFGAGLSSLSYLRDLPAHELKIDQTFIRSLTTSNRDPLLVRSAIEIAKALEMEVTAEGVEDELALDLLRVMRCNNVQGFHISHPLPLDALIAYLLGDDGGRDMGELNQLRERFGRRDRAA